MPNYLARVELHKATSDDYEVLHEAMRQRSFSRAISSNDQSKYRLPTGTYVAEHSGRTLDQIYDAATAAANATGKSSWVLVVDWQSGKFNLDRLP